MKSLTKSDAFSAAFELQDGGKVALKSGVTIGKGSTPPLVVLPRKLTAGYDYVVVERNGKLKAMILPLEDAFGGFHVGLDGKILPNSIWDSSFRPACPDPRGMVLVAGIFWVDIYLLNSEPDMHGTSRAGAPIADGSTPPSCRTGGRSAGLNWWQAVDILKAHGKQLLSVAEFVLAAAGVTEGKTLGRDPQKTGHVKGLCSAAGLEQATGCMWTWSRDITQYGYPRVLGGSWVSAGAGSRRLGGCGPDDSGGYIGARGRCDHLILA